MFPSFDLEGLLQIFQIDKKKDLNKHCRRLVIHGDDFANIILGAKSGMLGPYLHRIHHRDFQDIQLAPRTEELHANPQKALKKVQQLFSTRRLLVGHMFYTLDHQFWHFFYFDQRDTSQYNNQWKHGPHLHFINYLWPDRSASSVWSEFTTGNPKMKGSLHVRYKDEQEEERN